MQQFTDNQDHTWDIQITLHTAKRLRNDGVDLLNVEAVNDILSDAIEMFNLLYLICEPQAKQLGINDEQFGERLTNCAEEAINGLVEELENFYQGQGMRPQQAALIRQVWKASTMERKRGTSLMKSKKTDQAIQKVMDKAMKDAERELDKLSGQMSGSSQESSD